MKISSEKREKLDLLRKLVSANSLTHPSQRTPAQVPAAFWADPEFASLALQKSRSFLEFVSSDLLTNMDFMTKMGMCSAVSLEDVGKKRPIDRDLALALLPSEKTLVPRYFQWEGGA